MHARDGYRPPEDVAGARVLSERLISRVPFAELHVHSNFSFLDGASHPEELAEEASRLGLDAIALTDHDGVHGVVRLAEAGRALGVPTAYGVEMNLGLERSRAGAADPGGEHLLALARDAEGYRRLCRVVSAAHLAGEGKGRPRYDLEQVVDELAGHVLVLTGCRKGRVRRALAEQGARGARRELAWLADRFGRGHVAVELVDQRIPGEDTANDVLAGLAREAGVPVVAGGGVHYAHPRQARLAAAMAAVRVRGSLDEVAGWLPPGATRHLRGGVFAAQRFARFPGAVTNAAVLGLECAFDLRLVAPSLPPFPVGEGHTEDSWLRHLTMRGARERYGAPHDDPRAHRQLEHELTVIAELGFAGYFLIVASLVAFCRERGIYCQGRGSAANSAVCFALGVTTVDPVKWDLMFERFLNSERAGSPPDIDLDIESDRREEVIQHVYDRYGRDRAALVSTVITYRARSAVRDAARALGYPAGQIDTWTRRIGPWEPLSAPAGAADTPRPTGTADDFGHGPREAPVPEAVVELARQFEGVPRHLGIHVGGMVLSDRPVSEVCPVEKARMVDRTVLQWDKDDCAAVGLVKFDLLGLGMLSAVRYTVELIARHEGVTVDLAKLDMADPEVYDMLCRGDSIGVFQVESRAQINTLPRLRPRSLWDLAVEVGLIRPGPIQGGSVHPYLRRRAGEPWQHAHPLLARALDRTLGVPLFQEQLLRIAVDVAGFTPAAADELRRAMGSKRSALRMERLQERFLDGARANGVPGELAERIFGQIRAFATYGFPLAHAMAFAGLVYQSSWLKRYHPAALLAGLLRAQPMGFYSPQSLVADARRHGVLVRGVDINASRTHADLEPDPGSTGGQAVRLGLAAVRGLGTDLAGHVVAERDRGGHFRDPAELARRTGLPRAHLEALATAGAFTSLGRDRRAALWEAGAAAREHPGTLPGTAGAAPAPALPGMTALELLTADAWATGISPDSHPITLLRVHLRERGALTTAELAGVDHGTRILVGGVVTHRQRPATAGGTTFLNLEDETGMTNVICSPGLWDRYRVVAGSATALLVRGLVESGHGGAVVNIQADQLLPLDLRTIASRPPPPRTSAAGSTSFDGRP